MPNSPRAPKKTTAGPDEEAIRRRAYEIAHSPEAGTPEENWLRAEQELGLTAAPSAPRKTTKPKTPTRTKSRAQTKKTDEP